MSPTPLEIVESIDMLRVLEHGMKVRMIPTKYNTVAVDTEMDRQTVEKLLADDPTTSLYCDHK
jgi:3-deoxy-manno-octulosonate cytidylyltransferase (CMP-KDO synthetase)